MTRELLESAAMAAGMIPREFIGNQNFIDGLLDGWNPLADDGDALRLAVKLKIDVDHNAHDDNKLWVMASRLYLPPVALVEFGDEGRRLAATRRAITRAAAAIGEKVK